MLKKLTGLHSVFNTNMNNSKISAGGEEYTRKSTAGHFKEIVSGFPFYHSNDLHAETCSLCMSGHLGRCESDGNWKKWGEVNTA